ncbi:MAG: deaminase [Candidatus Spechtbacterales bacterium]
MAEEQKTTYRPSWDEFWLTQALFYSTRGTCDRLRTACILVDKNNKLIGAGYNGSVPGDKHCDDDGHMLEDGHCVRTLHAEENSVLHSTGDVSGATAYMLAAPCIDCAKKLITKGVKRIVYTNDYKNSKGKEHVLVLTQQRGISLEHNNIDFNDTLDKMKNILEGPGGAFHGK